MQNSKAGYLKSQILLLSICKDNMSWLKELLILNSNNLIVAGT